MIVVLTEEPSSAEMLKRVIPKILPDMLPQLDLQIVEHRGIGDLKAKLPSLLRGWPGDARFIVVCDRDRRDCVEVKGRYLRSPNPTTGRFWFALHVRSWSLGISETLTLCRKLTA